MRGRERNIRSEEYFVKDRPDCLPGMWEIKLVSCFTNLLDDFEGAVALVIKLLQRSISRNVLSFQPDLGFGMGNPRVGNSVPAPVPAITVPVAGTGTHRTRLAVVLYETCGMLNTQAEFSSSSNLIAISQKQPTHIN